MSELAQPVQSGFVRFVIVGQREGFSGYLGPTASSRHRFRFENGVCTLPFQEAELSRQRLAFHAAYPEGSQALSDAQEAWRKQSGSTATPTTDSDVRPAGEESPQGSAVSGQGDAETTSGDSGSVPGGDGSERASDEVKRAMPIEEAVGLLDHSKDDHWTLDGKPQVKLIQQLCKDGTITRDQVDEVGVVRKQN